MNSAGKLLRSTREKQGRSLAEIANELCVTQRYLQAIENDDLENLPGTFFYKSFAKQYANILGIPSARIQALIDEVVPAPEAVPAVMAQGATSTLHLNVASPSSSSPVRQPDALLRQHNQSLSDNRIGWSIATLAVVLLACSGFYAWWMDSRRPPAPAAVTESLPPPNPEPKPAITETAAVQEAVTVPVTQDPDGTNHAELNLSATEETWISITSAGKVIFAGVLEPSQTKTLTGIEGARIKLGNAGGIEIRWRGKDVGPIGPRGQVRTVLLKPDDVEIINPAATPPDANSTL